MELTNQMIRHGDLRDPDTGERLNFLIGEVKIPEKVMYNGIVEKITSIEEGAFAGYYMGGFEIDRIEIPDNVKVGRLAFAELDSLESVKIGKGVEIGEYAFNQCGKIEVEIADDVKIGKMAFHDCEIDRSSLPDNVDPEFVNGEDLNHPDYRFDDYLYGLYGDEWYR